MDEFIAVYLYDIKRSIEEVESYFDGYKMRGLSSILATG